MTRSSFIIALCVIFSNPILTSAQTVRVDATPSHVVNKFSPLYALGSTVDRVPSNVTDMFSARPDQADPFGRVGRDQLPAEHGLVRPGLALES